MLIVKEGLRNARLTWLMTILVGLYFTFSSLDYVAKIGGGNASYLRVFGIAIYAIGFLEMVFSRRVIISKFELLLFYLIALPFVACVWAVNPSSGFNRALNILTTVLVVFFVMQFDFNEKQIHAIELFSVLGAMIVGYILIEDQGLNMFLSGGRIYLSGDKNTSDPNGMAARLVLPLFISIKLIVSSKKRYMKIVYAATFSVIVLLFLMCGSRGGTISVLFGIVIYLLKSTKMNSRRRELSFIIPIFIIIVFLIFAKDILPSYIYSRLFESGNYTSGAGRTFIWETFLQKIYWSSPIIGFGTNGVQYKIGEQLGYGFYAMHNSYLCMIGEYGILYIPVFMYFLYFIRNKIANLGNSLYFSIFYSICGVIFFLDGYETKYFWNMITYIIIISKYFNSVSMAESIEHY